MAAPADDKREHARDDDRRVGPPSPVEVEAQLRDVAPSTEDWLRAQLRQCPIIDGTTRAGACALWKTLAWHHRRWKQPMSVRRYIDGLAWCPTMPPAPQPPELVWVNGMIELTEALLATADDAGIDVDPMLVLLRDLRRIAEGETVAIPADGAMAKVGLIVDKLTLWSRNKGRVRTEEPAAVGVAKPPRPLKPEIPPSDAHIQAANVQPERVDPHVVGWDNILPVLGYEPKNRRARDVVRRLNETSDGPIVWVGRSVTAPKERLVAWWNSQKQKEAEDQGRQATVDRNAAVTKRDLANPGVRKDEGLHLKERPNTRKRDSS